MSQSGSHFKKFRAHTLLKHRILESYLQAWANKLLRRPQREPVFFVDAFAGPGKDEEGNPGSPVIATRIAAAVTAERGLPGREMRVIAIEQKASTATALHALLAPFNANGERVTVLAGQLRDHIDTVVEITSGSPTLYFLDPFGLQGLEASTYPKALAGDHNEIFALLADSGVGRLFGLVTANSGGFKARLAEVRSTPTLFPESDREIEQEVLDELEEYENHLDVSRPAARKYLTKSLGNTDWEQALGDCPKHRRREVFRVLFTESLLAAGATHVLAIPMRDERGRRIYSLVHASKSAAAFQAMKAAVSQGLNRDLLPEQVRDQIREDLSVDMEQVMKLLGERFAGVEVGWVMHVQPYLLRETSMFDFQLPAVRATLQDLGYLSKVGRGRIMVRIPAL